MLTFQHSSEISKSAKHVTYIGSPSTPGFNSRHLHTLVKSVKDKGKSTFTQHFTLLTFNFLLNFMRISRRKRPQKSLIPKYKKNTDIDAPILMVLDSDGKNLGEMSKREALDLALERELDLVEINPKVTPPVTKLINFAEFKYQKEKEARKQKAHSRASETKGIRLSVRIGSGDLEMKAKQAEKFLNRGDKVKIELQMRGRENARPDMAQIIVSDFITRIETTTDIKKEQEITKQGRKITAVIVKK